MRGRTAQKRNHVCQFLCFQEEENGAAGTRSSMPIMDTVITHKKGISGTIYFSSKFR